MRKYYFTKRDIIKHNISLKYLYILFNYSLPFKLVTISILFTFLARTKDVEKEIINVPKTAIKYDNGLIYAYISYASLSAILKITSSNKNPKGRPSIIDITVIQLFCLTYTFLILLSLNPSTFNVENWYCFSVNDKTPKL